MAVGADHVPPVSSGGPRLAAFRLAKDATADRRGSVVGASGDADHGGEAQGVRGGAASAQGGGGGVRGKSRVVPRHSRDQLLAAFVQGGGCCLLSWAYLRNDGLAWLGVFFPACLPARRGSGVACLLLSPPRITGF